MRQFLKRRTSFSLITFFSQNIKEDDNDSSGFSDVSYTLTEVKIRSHRKILPRAILFTQNIFYDTF